jgi:hypothetical protein
MPDRVWRRQFEFSLATASAFLSVAAWFSIHTSAATLLFASAALLALQAPAAVIQRKMHTAWLSALLAAGFCASLAIEQSARSGHGSQDLRDFLIVCGMGCGLYTVTEGLRELRLRRESAVSESPRSFVGRKTA